MDTVMLTESPVNDSADLQQPWSVDNSFFEGLRPATCSRDPEILLNAQHYCTEIDRAGSRGRTAGRRNLNCQHALVREVMDLRAQLRETKRENTSLYDFNSTMYITIDSNYRIERVNFEAALFLDMDRKRLLTTCFLDLITFNSRFNFKHSMDSVLKTNIKQTCDVEVLQHGGGRRQVVLVMVALKNQLIGLSLIDMTPLRQAETQVMELKNLVNIKSSVIQYSEEAIAGLDCDLSVKTLNQAFIDIFYTIFSVKIQRGMNLNTLLSDCPLLKNKIVMACQQAILYDHDSVLIENTGHKPEVYYCYNLKIRAIYNKGSGRSELIFRICNLTACKLEEQRQYKQQSDIALSCRVSSMSDVASVFSHEINQPLAAIMAYSLACINRLQQVSQDEEITKSLLLLHKIKEQAIYVGNILHNMQNLTQDEPFQREETDINALVLELVSILDHETVDFKLTITLDLMYDIANPRVNKIHIMQVMLNLVRNSIEALKTTPEYAPELVIQTRQLNEHIVVHVLDNGPGIPAEFQHKLFTTYFTTKLQGMGMGLGICRSLIEAHGGELSLHASEKKGVWFTFTLPID